MTNEEKLMKMFIEVHGDIDNEPSSCYTEFMYSEDDPYGDAIGIKLMKDGYECWHESKTDILFNYITKNW